MFVKCKKNYDEWEKSFYGFRNRILPLYKKNDLKTNSGDQQPDIPDRSEQTRFNDFLEKIKDEQRDMDMDFIEERFGYKTSEKMLQTLHNLKNRVDGNANEANLIKYYFQYFENKVKKMSEGVSKNKEKKILRIVNKILDFNFNGQN